MAFHHFKGSGLNRSEKIQKFVVRTIMESKIPNEKRENSLEFEFKHSSGVIQIARIFAEKRRLNVEIAEIIAALHDIYAIINGTYKNHASEGARIARKILEESGDFKKEEISLVCDAIEHHSEKDVYTDKPYAELIKDADTFDCFLYADHGYDDKPPKLRKEYFKRIISLRKELELPEKEFYKNELEKLQ